jgi:hypothetical protein
MELKITIQLSGPYGISMEFGDINILVHGK